MNARRGIITAATAVGLALAAAGAYAADGGDGGAYCSPFDLSCATRTWRGFWQYRGPSQFDCMLWTCNMYDQACCTVVTTPPNPRGGE